MHDNHDGSYGVDMIVQHAIKESVKWTLRIEHNGVVVREVPIAIARGDDSLYGRIAPLGKDFFFVVVVCLFGLFSLLLTFVSACDSCC